jgi:hypothetical protein
MTARLQPIKVEQEDGREVSGYMEGIPCSQSRWEGLQIVDICGGGRGTHDLARYQDEAIETPSKPRRVRVNRADVLCLSPKSR